MNLFVRAQAQGGGLVRSRSIREERQPTPATLVFDLVGLLATGPCESLSLRSGSKHPHSCVLHIHERPIRNRPGGKRPPLHSLELYDLGADPGCTRNLAPDRLEEARKLRGMLADWLAMASSSTWLVTRSEHDSKVLDQLAELGYATDDRGPTEDSPWLDPDCACENCLLYR